MIPTLSFFYKNFPLWTATTFQVINNYARKCTVNTYLFQLVKGCSNVCSGSCANAMKLHDFFRSLSGKNFT